jgi:hypothetical protein
MTSAKFVRMTTTTYRCKQQDENEGVGYLAPEHLVPFHPSASLKFVGSIFLEPLIRFSGSKSFEGVGGKPFSNVFDSKGVERYLWLDLDSLALYHNEREGV